MLSNECPICHRYFPVGLYDHIEECSRRERAKAPHGYESFEDYMNDKAAPPLEESRNG